MFGDGGARDIVLKIFLDVGTDFLKQQVWNGTGAGLSYSSSR